jgi:hypothetical protein
MGESGMTTLPLALLGEEPPTTQWLVSCRPKLPYASQMPSFFRVIVAKTEKAAIIQACQLDPVFLDLNSRYRKTKAVSMQESVTYRVEP